MPQPPTPDFILHDDLVRLLALPVQAPQQLLDRVPAPRSLHHQRVPPCLQVLARAVAQDAADDRLQRRRAIQRPLRKVRQRPAVSIARAEPAPAGGFGQRVADRKGGGGAGGGGEVEGAGFARDADVE